MPKVEKMKLAQAWWRMLVMPAKRLRQEDCCEFKTCLNYMAVKKEEGEGEEKDFKKKS